MGLEFSEMINSEILSIDCVAGGMSLHILPKFSENSTKKNGDDNRQMPLILGEDTV